MIRPSLCFMMFSAGLPAAAVGQLTARQVLDSALHHTRATSLYGGQANWETLISKARELAAYAGTVEELKPALEYVLNALPDPHGRYLHPTTFRPIATFTDWPAYNATSPDQRERNRQTWAIVNDESRRMTYSELPNRIGYVRIVGIGAAADMRQEAERIRSAITELAAKRVTGWILDLRYNSGGNMNPMMAGIAPLVGDAFLGYLANQEGDTLGRWHVRGNNFFWDDYQAVELFAEPNLTGPPPLAVLLSRYTLSSGEFVAVALKHRPRTRFFGEASGGLTTSTNWVRIGEQLIVSISHGIYADRAGTMYRRGVPVDEEAPFTADADLESDAGVLAAMRWLRGPTRQDP